MKHQVIRLHPLGCACSSCAPRPVMRLRPIVMAAVGIAFPVYGLVWALWTILPN